MLYDANSRELQLSWESGRPAWSAFKARVSLVVLQYLPLTFIISLGQPMLSSNPANSQFRIRGIREIRGIIEKQGTKPFQRGKEDSRLEGKKLLKAAGFDAYKRADGDADSLGQGKK